MPPLSSKVKFDDPSFKGTQITKTVKAYQKQKPELRELTITEEESWLSQQTIGKLPKQYQNYFIEKGTVYQNRGNYVFDAFDPILCENPSIAFESIGTIKAHSSNNKVYFIPSHIIKEEAGLFEQAEAAKKKEAASFSLKTKREPVKRVKRKRPNSTKPKVSSPLTQANISAINSSPKRPKRNNSAEGKHEDHRLPTDRRTSDHNLIDGPTLPEFFQQQLKTVMPLLNGDDSAGPAAQSRSTSYLDFTNPGHITPLSEKELNQFSSRENQQEFNKTLQDLMAGIETDDTSDQRMEKPSQKTSTEDQLTNFLFNYLDSTDEIPDL